MQISLMQAALMGLYYWFSQIRWIYGSSVMRPLFAGMICGLILGDLKTGVMIGAIIQPMFLVFTGGGGTIVWDQTAGTIAGCAITMAGGLPIQQALPVAVPVSLLFAQLHTVRRIWFAVPAGLADKAAETGNDKAIVFYGSYFCWMTGLVLYFVPMTVALLFGAEAVGRLMANLPAWMTNALSAVGGVLPALGTAMTIRVIGRPMFWPFFLAGFFLVQYTNIGGLYLAFVGMFFAFLYYLIIDASSKKNTEADGVDPGSVSLDENSNRLLTKKDVRRMFYRWQFYCEQSNSFARLQSIGFCIAFIPALKKLYGNDKKEYSDALKRHLMFFNTQGIWGSVIHGIVLAMEEQRALGAPIDIGAITGLKAGLMGPFAGIGDTIDWATMVPLVTIIVLPLAQAGNALGPILQFAIILTIVTLEGRFFSMTGYIMGTRAAQTILHNQRIQTFISVAAVLGLFMLGGLASGFVKVVTPIFIATGATPLKIQTDVLNKIAPGLLPLGVILFTYWFIQKGYSMSKAALLLTFLGLGLGAAGVIGNGGLIFNAYVAPKV